MSDTAHGHVLKLNRAHNHLKDLEDEADTWLDGDHHTITHEYDADAATYHVFAEAERPPRDPLALLIGDFLHGVRSGLDHLAYSLAEAHTGPLPKDVAEDSEFPIFGDEDRKGQSGRGAALFQNAAVKKLRGIHRDARAFIESVQPYQLGARFAEHDLFVLYDLARIDRHRLLHPVVAYFSGFGIRSDSSHAIIGKTGANAVIHSFEGTLEQRAKVARIVGIWPLGPDEPVYMDVVLPLKLAFPGESGAAAGKDVVETLGRAYNYVVSEVVRPLEAFL